MSNKRQPQRKSQLIFTSKNEALSFQKDYQRHGYIKKCYHAKIGPYGHEDSYFVPNCVQSSYIYVDKEQYFLGCPDSCAYYQSQRYGKAINSVKKLRYRVQLFVRSVVHTIKWLLEWFASLASSVQIILALCFLVLVLGKTPFYDLILELIKTLFPQQAV